MHDAQTHQKYVNTNWSVPALVHCTRVVFLFIACFIRLIIFVVWWYAEFYRDPASTTNRSFSWSKYVRWSFTDTTFWCWIELQHLNSWFNPIGLRTTLMISFVPFRPKTMEAVSWLPTHNTKETKGLLQPTSVCWVCSQCLAKWKRLSLPIWCTYILRPGKLAWIVQWIW